MIPYRHSNIQYAKKLRKSMTKEERHLWYDFLRDYPVKIYRQRAIDNYIVDFYCSKAKLVIEVDGSQHYEEAGRKYDMIRTSKLEKYGLTVVRYSNLDVMKNFRGVCADIDRKISAAIGTVSLSQ